MIVGQELLFSVAGRPVSPMVLELIKKEGYTVPSIDKFIHSITASNSELAPSVEPRKTITVLAITGSQEDHVFLRKIFCHTRWLLIGSQSLREAVAIISQCQVVLSEADLPDGNWKDVLQEVTLAASKHDQLVPPQVIVISRLADERLWAEVLDRGAFNLLAKPFDPKELTRLISSAWRCRQKQCEQIGGIGFAADLEVLAKKIGPNCETAVVKRASA